MARYRSLFLFIACALVAAVHSEQGKREHHASASASASALMSSPVDNEPELVRIESAIEPSRRKNNFRPVLFKNRHLEESAAIEVEYEQVCKLMVYMQAHLWYAHYVKILTTCGRDRLCAAAMSTYRTRAWIGKSTVCSLADATIYTGSW